MIGRPLPGRRLGGRGISIQRIADAGGSLLPTLGSDDFEVITRMSAPDDGIFDLIDYDLTEYQRIVVAVDGLTVEADDTSLFAHLYIDNVLEISGYRYFSRGLSSSGSGSDLSSTAAAGVLFTTALDSSASLTASNLLEIGNADTAVMKTVMFDMTRINDTPVLVENFGLGILEETGNITGILINGSSPLLSGSLTLYGVKYGSRTGAAVTPATLSMWSGALTETGAAVVFRLTANANVRLAYSTNSDLSSPSYMAAKDTMNGVARFDITGLSADTTYYYGVEIDGTLDTVTIGSFKTLGATSLKVCLSGDSSTGSSADVFSDILAEAPNFFIHLGDSHYENIADGDEGHFLGAIDATLAATTQEALYRQCSTVFMFDDHDYGDNDSAAASPSRTAFLRAFRRRVPTYTPVETDDGDAIYYSFEVDVDGIGVVFIVTDQRSMASPKGDTDNSSKTMLGTAQKTWFKNLLSDAGNDGKLFVWCCARVWGGVAAAGADHWGGFTTERTEIADHIQANCSGRLIVLSADMHALAIDDGTNHDFVTTGNEPIPTFQASPLDRTSNLQGGATYSEGTPAQNNGQYGVMDISKTGASQLTVDWTGKRDTGATLVTYQMVFNL